ncbi:MAG: FAD-dependent thymidylate synthase [Sulfuricurvum sp.]|jgi:thymidylate synthase (FAD)|uniref:FAD-dependent thymidylate synthase n=1 Tax=Sulfuricurvum sp. TaxID=2025608 RepID=UPI0025DF2283|nr:FAD-dependent thymidylate synthase [Sulfuricurvum sp.]MCK9371862.1 FAD-dependent thymidylate synthase [Sulfuricurvum sp.]
MKVTLHHYTPLVICSDAIRTCWQSFDKSDNGGDVDRALIDRVGNKFKHASTLEHIVYNFYIEGVSRALLQELARHRMASLSVKSTRYTLKELKDEAPFTLEEKVRAEKYLVMTGVDIVDQMSLKALENLRIVLADGISNDRAKYCLPESYKTELTWSINARSLQNFLSLRSDKAALWEIRDLANTVYETLPEEHRYLFENSLKGDH